MKGISLRLYGQYAMFKLPESNSKPRTALIPPKTAIIGLIGALCGIKKNENEFKNRFYPKIFDHIKYAVKLNGDGKNNRLGLISSCLININDLNINKKKGVPGIEEYVINPDYIVYLVLVDESDPEINKLFDDFVNVVKHELVPSSGISYDPYLGRSNCKANYDFISSCQNISKKTGIFETSTACKRSIYKILNFCRITIYDLMVKLNNNNEIIDFQSYMIPKGVLKTEGEYYEFNDEKIVLS